MKQLHLQPVEYLSGTLHLPGSKSISNRALLLAALATGDTELKNLLDSEDINVMRSALNALGVSLTATGTSTVHVRGCSGPIARTNEHLQLDMGLAGTAIRPLAAALCAGSGRFTLDGVHRMRERPIGHLVDALRELGADIRYDGEQGFPPITIQAGTLQGGVTHIAGHVSSQFLTAVLLAAPLAAADVTIELSTPLVSRPYIDITLAMMARFGVQVTHDNYQRFHVPAGRYTSPGAYLVEGDASSASYFLAAGAVRGAGVRVTGIGTASLQGDVAFADTLRQMGASVSMGTDWVEVKPGTLRAIDVDLNHIPDAAMTLAPLALLADGTTWIRNIGNWRVKETDRLLAMATELRKFGAEVIEGPDFLCVTPPRTLRGATVDTYGDHRMAMSLSLVALGGVPVTINDPGCVAKTFPDYFERFEALAGRRVA